MILSRGEKTKEIPNGQKENYGWFQQRKLFLKTVGFLESAYSGNNYHSNWSRKALLTTSHQETFVSVYAGSQGQFFFRKCACGEAKVGAGVIIQGSKLRNGIGDRVRLFRIKNESSHAVLNKPGVVRNVAGQDRQAGRERLAYYIG